MEKLPIRMFHALSAFFFLGDTATTEIYTLSHTTLFRSRFEVVGSRWTLPALQAPFIDGPLRSEEHTSELQSRFDLVCRLLLEKKKVVWFLRQTRKRLPACAVTKLRAASGFYTKAVMQSC